MIHLTRIPNVFEPYRQERSSVAFRPGRHLSDVLPDGYELDEPNVAVWHNGARATSDAKVKRGDYIHFVAAPTGAETWWAVGQILALLFVAYLVAKVTGELIEELAAAQQQSDPFGDSTYGYYGFRNSYRSEGDALPLVYGTMRVAPPCINQSVLGALPWTAVGGKAISSRVESLNVMYAVSRGPIEGFGTAIGPVYDQEAFEALVPFNNGGVLAGVQFNGIDGKMFVSSSEWRTGGATQTPITGIQGFLTGSEPATHYPLSFEINDGLYNISGEAGSGEYEAGKYTYATRIQSSGSSGSGGTGGTDAEFISLFLAAKADIASVQFLWARGLYVSDPDDGKPLVTTALMRVQYWETDSSDTTPSSSDAVVITPPILVSSSSPSPISVEWPMTLIDPDTYGAPVQYGYVAVQGNVSSYAMNNNNTTGLKLLQPGSGDLDSNLQYSMSFWVRATAWEKSRVLQLVNWTWVSGGAAWTGAATDTGTLFFHPDRGGAAAEGLIVQLVVDTNNKEGGGTDQVYFRFYNWEQSGAASTTKCCWWRSEPLGHRSTFGSWTNTGASSLPPSHHFAFSYDQTTWTADGTGEATVKMWLDGVEKTIAMGRKGADYSGSWGTKLGWLYGGSGETEKHIRARIPTKNDVHNMLRIGAFRNWFSTGPGSYSRMTICEFLLMDGLIDPGLPYIMANSADLYGNLNFTIKSLAYDDNVKASLRICAPLDTLMLGTTNFFENFAPKTIGSTSEAGGGIYVERPANILTGGPINSGATGTPKRAYYHIEVFKEAPTIDSSAGCDLTTVDGITTLLTQSFSYPDVAVYASKVTATDQLNSTTPAVTMLVNGRLVNIWDGVSESTPQFSFAFSRNPAWVALDLLTGRSYGMGDIFAPNGEWDNIDLPSFLTWAKFCDEGTPDAYGEVTFFSLTTGSTTDAVSGVIDYWVTVYVGLIDSSDAVHQVLPPSWRIGKFDSITEVVAGEGLGQDWVTKDDIVGGKNDASNMMVVKDVTSTTPTSTTGGFNGYAEVRFAWNRLDSTTGLPIWPKDGDGADIITGQTITAAGGTSSDYLGKLSQYEVRCQFDGVFDQKNKPGWDSILEVFSAGRAMPVKAGNKMLAAVDQPRDPVALFGQGNTVEGSMKITYLSQEVAPNSIEIEILDSDHNYERRTVLVDHPSVQDPTQFASMRKERIALRGITRRSQATREGVYRLNRYNLIRRDITFQAGPDALTLIPGDRILVSHDVPQYGYSGRLAEDATIVNSHPGGDGIYLSWVREGGDCTVSDMGLLEDGTAAPITGAGYAAKAVQAYAAPVVNQNPAGSQKASGYEAGPTWAQQYVAVGDGLYPYPGNPSTNAIAPLDIIDDPAKKIAFSCYFKEPSTGASEYILLNFYRFCSDSDAFVKVSHAARFNWSGGTLTTDGFEGAGGVTSGVDNTGLDSGWYRATMVYDNVVGGGDVGDYIQLRAYFSYTDLSVTAPIQQFHTVADGGRGVQFLKYGDPMDVDGLTSPATPAWTKANDDVGSNSIANSTTSAPPFYPGDTGGAAGTHGYVLNLKTDQPANNAVPCIRQAITLPTDFPGSGGAGDMADEAICCTFFLRVAADNAAALADITVSLMMSTDGILYTGAINPGWFSNLSNQARFNITGFGGTPTVTYSDLQTGGATQTELLSQISPVVQNSTTNDANWYQVDVAFSTSLDFPTLYFLAGMRGNSGGTGGTPSVDFWGFRVHGAAGTTTPVSTDLVNPYYHRGSLMWGPMYEPNYAGAGTTPGTFGVGATVKLDRDVTLDTGETYEVSIRSSSKVDMTLGKDAYQLLRVASNEVPGSGSTTKTARTALAVSSPNKFGPQEGDIYSFGKTSATVEDMTVTSIDLNPETLVRSIKCIEYVEEIYDDTAFGTLGDATISDLPSPGGGDSALAGAGDDGRGSAISLRATPFPYRNPNGGVMPAIYVSWSTPFGSRLWKESRLWMSQIDDDNVESAPQFLALVSSSVTEYRHDDPEMEASRRYRFRLQRIGLNGTAEPLMGCAFVDVYPVLTPPLSPAPTVSVSTSGYKQMYDVAATGTMRPAALEGRVGGWLISLPGYIVDPDVDRTATEAIVLGATNSAGDTNTSIVTREKLASGKYGVANTTTPADTVVFDDARTTTTIIGENDYAALGIIPVDLDVTSNVLHWDAGSSATGPVYYAFAESDLTTAQRVVATAIIQGYQVRPETLADLNFTLGSEDGRRWSIEGPMDNDGTNATVKLEWRWTSGASLLSEEYRPFEAGEVYFRKCQFRLVWTRPTDSYDVKLERFVVRLYTPPLFAPGDVDGGTF